MADPLIPFVDSTDTTLDVDGASAAIRGYCGWHVWPSLTETLVLDGPGAPVVVVPTLHLTAVTAMAETPRGTGQSPVTVDVDELEWSRSGWVRRSSGCWTARARGISITVTHGHDGPPPADVAQVCLALAKRAQGNPGGLRRMQVGQRAEDYAGSGLLMDEKSALDQYRRLR